MESGIDYCAIAQKTSYQNSPLQTFSYVGARPTSASCGNSVVAWSERSFWLFALGHMIYGLYLFATDKLFAESDLEGVRGINRFALSLALLCYDALLTSINAYSIWHSIHPSYLLSDDEAELQRQTFPSFFTLLRIQTLIWIVCVLWGTASWALYPHFTNLFIQSFVLAAAALITLLSFTYAALCCLCPPPQ